MRLPRASLCVLLFVGFRTLGSDGAGVNHLVSDCVEPQGIEPGGGDGVLDLNHLLSPETGLGKPLGPLDFTVPIIPTVSVIAIEERVFFLCHLSLISITVGPCIRSIHATSSYAY